LSIDQIKTAYNSDRYKNKKFKISESGNSYWDKDSMRYFI
jgi:hypothetical protein